MGLAEELDEGMSEQEDLGFRLARKVVSFLFTKLGILEEK